jgi:integrase
MRASELLALRWGDVAVDRSANGGNGALWIHIRRSKTDQLGVGRYTAVSLTGTDATSPLLWWSRYELGIEPSGRSIVEAESAVVRAELSWSGASVSYGQWLRFVRACMVGVGIAPHLVGSHSLRRGGASAAIACGVPLTSVMAMAGWRSVSSALLYTTADDEHVVAASAVLAAGTAHVAQYRPGL